MKKITILSAVAGLTILAAAAVQAQAGGALAALRGYAGAPAQDAPVTKAEVAGGFTKGYVEPVEPAAPIEYITIPGGKFTMGTTSIEQGFEDANFAHEVSIKTFQLAKAAVTVAQYAECVSKGACTEPGTSSYCNWGKTGLGSHPVNCVNWDQAQQYAKFKGARLPSEAEFEYAATSGGRNQKYPWGNEEPTSELAVFNTDRTMPVCSRPKGNTAQGLCDMSGNVWQWMQDKYRGSYKGAPTDGSAFESAGSHRVVRGGSFFFNAASYLRAGCRGNGVPGFPDVHVGFRLAR